MVVSSPDTDVLVLLLHHRVSIRSTTIHFLTGHSGKQISHLRYIPVHSIFEKLCLEERNILLAVYCLTGCDTVSSFYGHGKRTAFRVMTKKSGSFQALASLGVNTTISKQEKAACTAFVGALYGRGECESLDKLRCEKATKNIPPKKLPPTENSLHQHVLRCAYQLTIWRQADIAQHVLPDPEDFGYVRDSTNCPQPVMMTQPPAAPELLNDLVCSCSSCDGNCTCYESGQPCTAACLCRAVLPVEDIEQMCANPLTMSTIQEIDSDSDSE